MSATESSLGTAAPTLPLTRGRATQLALSNWLLALIALRPILNQFRGETALAKVGNYNISILSIWSVSFLALAAWRFASNAGPPSAIKKAIAGFLFVVFAFGVPRILLPETLITDVLVYCQFFLSVLTARSVIEDIGIDVVLRRLTLVAVVLLVMHATARLWAGPPKDIPEDFFVVSGYLGAFHDKHIAGETFLALMPFVVCAAMREGRRSLPTLVVGPLALALVLTGQRMGMLSLIIFACTMLALTRRVRVLGPLLIVAGLVAVAIPTDTFDRFVEERIQAEFDAFQAGEIDEVGGGRVAIILLAQTWFFEDYTVVEQLIGRGTAQAYKLAYITSGEPTYSHLQIIELLINYGLIGAGLVFVTFGLLARAKLRAYRRTRLPIHLVGTGMAVTAICMMFYAMPLHGGTAAVFAFWLFPPAEDR